jgi:hypothetical protein
LTNVFQEFFIGQVAKGAFEKSGGGTLDYVELAEFVQENEEMEFLHGVIFQLSHMSVYLLIAEIVPKKVKASEVWHLLERNSS